MTASFSLIDRDGITCALCGQWNIFAWETFELPRRERADGKPGRRNWRKAHICANCLAVIRGVPAPAGV